MSDARILYVDALERARRAAYPDDDPFVGQENFMGGSEILELAVRAGVGPGTRLLDLCCGVSGPGNHIARRLGSHNLGVDRSPEALELARTAARGLNCRFHLGTIPLQEPLGRFQVVLFLETMLAFRDKPPILRDIRRHLEVGGRLAMTFEEGLPLNEEERALMPDADTVWLTPLGAMEEMLRDCGFHIVWIEDHTDSHADTARRLGQAFRAERRFISQALGEDTLDSMLRAHDLWAEWMRRRRVRKFALVATACESSCSEPD